MTKNKAPLGKKTKTWIDQRPDGLYEMPSGRKIVSPLDLEIVSSVVKEEIIKKIIPFHEKYTVPASKRAWDKTKYDFHAGYSKACEDMQKKIEETIIPVMK